jgi:parvulin-like peptidyl-prolyl isomerase
MCKRSLLLLSCLFLLPVAPAVARADAEAPAAAVVNGEALPASVVDLMHRLARTSDAGVTRATVVQALIDDRLIAAHVRRSEPADEVIHYNKVAFSPAVQIEQNMVANLQAGFAAPLQASLAREKGGSLLGVVQEERLPSAAEWESVFGRPSGGLQREYLLEDDKARAAAGRVLLLRYRMGRDAPGRISLLDVYDAQNIQGRTRLHERDAAFAAEQARALLQRRYVLRWAESGDGLGPTAFAVFRRAVEDRLVHGSWMAHLGVSSDIHDSPEHLKALAAAVTPAEIRAYYDSHRDEFRRIDKVQARHIRLRDEATAATALERLKKGEDFAAVAKSLSTAPDATSGGDLGWIVQGETAHGWLDSVAFLQPPKVPSRPLRMPGGPGEAPAWEIVLVTERVEGWQAPDSESVAYAARQSLALQKAVQEYGATLARLRREADIRLEPALAQKGSGT